MPSQPPFTKPVWYVYGIVPANVPLSALPPGLDEATVEIEAVDDVAALFSELDAASYDPNAVEANSGDLEWLGPRAVAHDLILTRASDATQGASVPLPMFSLFSSRDAVRSMLRDRAPQLAATLREVSAGREYALRIYRVDRELMEGEHLIAFSPRLAELSRSAATASEGQRYLLERKLAAERKAELRAVSQRIVDDIVEQLSAQATRHVREPIPRAADGEAASRGTMVLNAAFLVPAATLRAFQSTLSAVVEQYDERGFRFDFTGPWPPYHFVQVGQSDA